jgi:hypothetical protein
MTRILLPCLAAALLLAGCMAGPTQPYPEPETRQKAADQREEFLEAFLSGRWCEAQSLFRASTLDYLRQDDFCAAAYNYRLAWRLTAYLSIPDQSLRKRAARLAELGLDCSGDPGGENGRFAGPRDEAWEKLVSEKRFDELLSRVRGEEDALYASVYARKGARQAMAQGDEDAARRLLRTARQRDARLGWLLFVIEDWKLLADLENNDRRARLISERIRRLEQLVEPCGPSLPQGERP